MNFRIVGSVLVTGLALVAGCDRATSMRARAEVEFTLASSGAEITAVAVDWSNGSIRVRGDATATEILATGKRYVQAKEQAIADAELENIAVALGPVDRQAGLVRLTFTAPNKATINYGADVELVVPATVALTIESANGAIDVSHLMGELTVKLANGAVRVVEQEGGVKASTANGSVRVEARGDVAAKSKNGQVVVDSSGGSVTAATNNGRVEVTARPPAAGTVKADSRNGAVLVRVPADFGAMVTLNTKLGSVDADLDGFAAVSALKAERTHLTATLNEGGGEIRATTSIGGVTLEPLATGN